MDPDYRKVDEYIRKSETFHRLDAPLRIRVVESSDGEMFRRCLPHLRGKGVAAVTLATGAVIYVSPRNGSYYSDDEFRARILREAVGPYIDPAWRGEVPELFEMRYAYIAWRRFNEQLMSRFGRDAHQRHLEAAIRDPREWREMFPEHFQGVSFENAIGEFQASAKP